MLLEKQLWPIIHIIQSYPINPRLFEPPSRPLDDSTPHASLLSYFLSERKLLEREDVILVVLNFIRGKS